jgi:hypothetical protein
MNFKKFIWLCFIFWAGCAAYKQLKPDPPISFLENGYIELKDDDEFFELDEGDKYFLKIPQPENENIYLVLTLNNKALIDEYLTRAFDDGKGTIIKIPDETEDPTKQSVYKLDRSVPTFYWIIEEVSQDMVMELTYRYVAIWRFKFENKHAHYKSILEQNTQDKNIYDAIGVSVSALEIDYAGEQSAVSQKLQNLKNIRTQLVEIESIFPSDILNSNDQSYQSYLKLKNDLDAELQFQEDYQSAMSILKSVSMPSMDMQEFVSQAPAYVQFLQKTDRYPENLLNESRKLVAQHLGRVASYFEIQLRKKNDTEKINFDIKSIAELHNICTISPDEDFTGVSKFINIFNKRSDSMRKVENDLKGIKEDVENISWPPNTFYPDTRVRLSQLRYSTPESDIESFGKYRSYACASLLNKSISNLRREINLLISQYSRAEQLVPHVNLLKNQGNYSEILRILKRNSDLSFLRYQYSDIDQLSLTQQKVAINQALINRAWVDAEARIRALYQDNNFLNLNKVNPIRNQLVREFEDTLLEQIESSSIQNATQFIDANKNNFENIDELYSDKSLSPVYQLTFTSATQSELVRRNQVLENRMSFLRHEKFPETAIETLYRSFSQAIHEDGVFKARAIVAHGKNYTGNNEKIKNLIGECDPNASKWLTQAKQYRKIYALPTTTNTKGENEYLVKVNIRIPSEAQFPVYDINVKLPREIARFAGERQWYERITFNNKLLKNEGRFSITSPTSENDYEAQITPLQVNKTGDNVLQIHFKYNSFKVFEVTVMAQKPIIKKN